MTHETDHSGLRIPIEGARIHWLWTTENEHYQHEAVFISRELYEIHEQYAFHTKEDSLPQSISESTNLTEVPVADLQEAYSKSDIGLLEEILPEKITATLHNEQVPRDLWLELILSDDLRQSIVSGKKKYLYSKTKPATVKTDKMGRHAQHEESLRKTERNLSNNSLDNEYSGPLFAYEPDKNVDDVDDIDASDLIERRAPINNGWNCNINKDASGVGSKMRNNGWSSGWANFSNRYVIVETRSGTDTQSQTDQVGKSLGKGLIPDQWHVRLFSIPQSMDSTYDVAGQAHKDPVDHGKIENSNQNWDFSKSRQVTIADWNNWGYTTANPDIGNEDRFNSSLGKHGQISL